MKNQPLPSGSVLASDGSSRRASLTSTISPVTGEIVEVNEALREDPSLANTDPLGNGWFFKVHLTDMAEFEQLMDGPAYDLLVKNS